MFEDKAGYVQLAISPEVMLQALTNYMNEHLLREPLKVIDVESYGYPIESWHLKCATTLQQLAGDNDA